MLCEYFFHRKSLRWDEWDGLLQFLSHTNWKKTSFRSQDLVSKKSSFFLDISLSLDLHPRVKNEFVFTLLLWSSWNWYWSILSKTHAKFKVPCWASKCIAIVRQNIFLPCMPQHISTAVPLCLDPIYPCLYMTTRHNAHVLRTKFAFTKIRCNGIDILLLHLLQMFYHIKLYLRIDNMA